MEGMQEACSSAHTWDDGTPIDRSDTSVRVAGCTRYGLGDDWHTQIELYDDKHLVHELCHFFLIDSKICGEDYNETMENY